MRTPPEIEIRELDRRTGDGIHVALLWNTQTNGVSVAVEDKRTGESFELQIEPADALAAFHHPYAYTQAQPHSRAGRLLHQRASEAPQAGAP